MNDKEKIQHLEAKYSHLENEFQNHMSKMKHGNKLNEMMIEKLECEVQAIDLERWNHQKIVKENNSYKIKIENLQKMLTLYKNHEEQMFQQMRAEKNEKEILMNKL